MYNAYHKKEDERLLLTPEMIFSHQKKKAVEDLLLSLGALVFFVLIWIADIVAISEVLGTEEATFSPLLAIAPILAGGLFTSCFCIHQWIQTASSVSCAWGRRYRMDVDTLERVSEREYEKLPFFSFKRFWGRGRGNFAYRERQTTVTAYYFAKNGRAISRHITIHDGDFDGDSFYLIIREKDGVILAVYNTKKYRLETEEA